jgi:hypothetical protein
VAPAPLWSVFFDPQLNVSEGKAQYAIIIQGTEA